MRPGQQGVPPMGARQAQQPPDQQGLIAGLMPEPEEPAEADPGYVSARDWLYDKMFGSGSGDQKVADAVRAAESDEEAMQVVTEIMYKAIDNADAQADPPMKEENIGALAMYGMKQFWDTAAAAMGGDIDPALIAASFKTVLLRFLREAGADTTELKRAMDQITPDQFRELVASTPDGSAEEQSGVAPEVPNEAKAAGPQGGTLA